MNTNKKPIAWTIAGSDSGGGAGIQADLHTFNDFNVHGCSVITAITAQNSFAVGHIQTTDHKTVAAQINALDSDLPAAAIKIGMLASSMTVSTVAKYLADYSGKIIYDPVMAASSGQNLLADDAQAIIRQQLLPRVDLLTPNIHEAETLSGIAIKNCENIQQAAKKLLALGTRAVLITGGHFDAINGQRLDYWSDGKTEYWLAGEDIKTIHSHGSGCTLSSAITAAIAQGYELLDALVLAKTYVSQGIRSALQIGSGPGPVAHTGYPKQLKDFPALYSKLPAHLNGSKAEKIHFADCSGALGLYPVVDSVEWLERLLPLGIDTIQLRIKDQTEEFLRDAIQQAVTLAEKYAARLFINDYWQLAIEAGAYGVHLGQEDLDSTDLTAIADAGLRLGISTHCYYEIARAHGIQPSYIAIGPIYDTTTKVMKFSARGLEPLQRWVSLLQKAYPLTAIGGISLQRAEQVLATGVGSVAVVTAITEATDYQQAVRKFLKVIQTSTEKTFNVNTYNPNKMF